MKPQTLSEAKQMLQNPDNTYRTQTFWSWNGDLQEEELNHQLAEFKDKGVGGFFMHANVAVAVYKTGGDQITRRLNDLGALGGGETGADGGDLSAFNEDITFGDEVSRTGIHLCVLYDRSHRLIRRKRSCR